MKRQTQYIHECATCGHVFEDGEDYWEVSRGECYCIDCDPVEEESE